MSDTDTSGFGKFVPGFDFLQNLAKGTPGQMPQMPDMAKWVAPTLKVEDLEKRIEELKNVQFWLEQNSRALAATVQALEVQKMTLATLQGMNFNVGNMAQAFGAAAPEPVTPSAEPPKATSPKSKTKDKSAVDPMQLWGALTQQFQHIAASAMKEVAANAQAGATKGAAKATAKATTKAAAPPAAPQKKAAAKPRAKAARSTGASKSSTS